jgi:hypothetical protein
MMAPNCLAAAVCWAAVGCWLLHPAGLGLLQSLLAGHAE